MNRWCWVVLPATAWALAVWPLNSSAWFIWIPTGAIARALEKDPDKIEVTFADRSLGKCAGYHINQYKGRAAAFPASHDEPGGRSTSVESPVASFHKEIADLAVAKAADKQKVIDLAEAYSTRWGRVASADINANRAYGADLAQGCVSNSLPFNQLQHAAWKARQEEDKLRQEEERFRQAEEERIRAAEIRRKQDEQEARSRAEITADSSREVASQAAIAQPQVDFAAEARKSARILGCNARDVKVTGADGRNVLFIAACETGEQLALTCEPSGTCLKR